MNKPERYVKKPVEVQAIRWTGENASAVEAFVGLAPSGACAISIGAEWTVGTEWSAELWVEANKQWLPIEIGEWIAKDRHGYYPIKNDVFTESYSPVQPEDDEAVFARMNHGPDE